MNKFFNSWILIVSVLIFPFALAVGLNEDFELFGLKIRGEEFAYKNIIFIASAAIVFLLAALKASKKWMGIRIIRQVNKFKFTCRISNERKNRVQLYNAIEVVYFLLFAFFFWYISPDSWIISFVFLVVAIEHLMNSIVGLSRNKYGIGLSSKALIRVDREVTVIYFKGLQKITKHQDTLYFDYVNGLNLFVPLNIIPKEKEADFYKELRKQVDPDKVYYSGF
jgi:hypothetical protein